jgi:hypothetical protein
MVTSFSDHETTMFSRTRCKESKRDLILPLTQGYGMKQFRILEASTWDDGMPPDLAFSQDDIRGKSDKSGLCARRRAGKGTGVRREPWWMTWFNFPGATEFVGRRTVMCKRFSGFVALLLVLSLGGRDV